MIRVFLFIFVFCSQYVAGQNPDQTMRQAEVYFEAEEYNTAKNLYESVLHDAPHPWQRAILLYNIGTVLLKENRDEEALTYLQKAEQLELDFPLLQERLLSNLAIAKLQLAKNKLQKPNTKIEEHFAVIALLRESLNDINDAEQAKCLLRKSEGAENCPPSVELKQLQSEAKQLLTDVLKQEAEESSRQWKALLNLIAEHRPFEEILHQLLLSYDHLLIQEPIQDGATQRIYEMQNNLTEMASEEGKEFFRLSQQNLKLGMKALKEGKVLQGRIFILAAKENIQTLLDKLEKNNLESKQILKQAIRTETLSATLNRLKRQSIGHEATMSELDLILKNSLQHPLSAAADFLEAAKKEQAKQYQKGTEKNVDRGWEQMISTFLSGKQLAQSALESYLQDSSQLQKVISLQQQAIDEWKEALKQLESILSESQEQSNQQKTEKEKAPLPENSISEVIRTLQDMENDDKSRPRLQNVPTKKEIKKPW